MAMRQEIIDRFKAQGFYKHVEWNRARGVLVKIFPDKVTFESGTFDREYDQSMPGYRQFFLERREAVKFMLNMGMGVGEIAQTFKMIDGMQVVEKYT